MEAPTATPGRPAKGRTPDIAELEAGQRRGTRPRTRTIVLATDLSAASAHACEEAIELAAALRAQLVVVNVLDPRDAAPDVPSHPDTDRTDRERALREIVAAARQKRASAAFLIWTDLPGPGIVAAAESEGADLIVVGTRGLDRAGRLMLGSVSDYVVNNSRCAVLIAR